MHYLTLAIAAAVVTNAIAAAFLIGVYVGERRRDRRQCRRLERVAELHRSPTLEDELAEICTRGRAL